MRAYQNFLTDRLEDLVKPIGWTVAVILSLWFVIGTAFPAIGRLASADPIHQQFKAACTLLEGTVEKVTGTHFCVKVTAHETILPPDIDRYKLQCREAGGIPKSRNMLQACYMFDIIEELGSRDSYKQ